MQPESLSLGNLLGDRIPFRIPLYQRGYAWEEDELEDFISDIGDLENADTDHFFGGILSVKVTAPGTRTGTVYELVDGQQRTTTFMILINAIADAYGSVAREAEAQGNEAVGALAVDRARLDAQDFLTFEDLAAPPQAGTVTKYRLQLSKRDDDFFQHLLTGDAPRLNRRSPYSHKLLVHASEKLRSELVDPIVNSEALTVDEKLESIQSLLARLTNRCYVIHITTDNRDEAYHLFTVLNDRGRSLSDGDLLRTRTLELLEGHHALQQEAEAAWDAILKSSPTQVRNFLRAYYASHQGRRWPSKDLHKAFWQAFFPFGSPIDEPTGQVVVERLKKLALEHEVFSRLAVGDWPYDDSTVSVWHTQRLNRLVKVLRQQASIPLLLSVHACRDQEFFSRIVTYLERFAFRYNISGGHASQLGDRYYVQAGLVRREQDDYAFETLEDALGLQLSRYGPDDIFRSNLIQRMNYQVSPAPLIKHFLTTLDDYAASLESDGDPQPDTVSVYDLQAIEVEHIYPQRPRVKVSDLDSHVHALGNLTFWSPTDNKAASNAPFEDKKPIYLQSRIRMTRDVGESADWTLATLLNRQETLVNRALAVFAFKMPLADVSDVSGTGAVWFVQQNPDSRYNDREGELYDYPNSIPNGQQIGPGHILICYRAKRVAVGDGRIFGIGQVERILPDGDRLLAVYGRYVQLDPLRSFDEIGGDPRNNRRNAINSVDADVLTRLLEPLGLQRVEDIELIEPNVEDLVEIGTEPAEESGDWSS
ncbi:MAG: DUF262 domain-containing protein [Actinomycetota bacterium]